MAAVLATPRPPQRPGRAPPAEVVCLAHRRSVICPPPRPTAAAQAAAAFAAPPGAGLLLLGRSLPTTGLSITFVALQDGCLLGALRQRLGAAPPGSRVIVRLAAITAAVQIE